MDAAPLQQPCFRHRFFGVVALCLALGSVLVAAPAAEADDTGFGLVFGQGAPNDQLESRTVGLDYQFRSTQAGWAEGLEGLAWVQATDWEADAGATPKAADGRDAWGLRLVYPLRNHRIEFSHHRLGEGVDPAGNYGASGGTEDTRLALHSSGIASLDLLPELNHEVQYRHTQSLASGDEKDGLTLRLSGTAGERSHRFQAWIRHEEHALLSGQRLLGDLWVDSGSYDHTRYGIAFNPAAGDDWSLDLHAEQGGYLAGQHSAVGARMNWRPLAQLRLDAELRMNHYRGADIGADDGLRAHSMSLRSRWLVNPWWSLSPGIKYDSIDQRMGLEATLKWTPNAMHELLIDWKRSLLMGIGAGAASGMRDSIIMGRYGIRL